MGLGTPATDPRTKLWRWADVARWFEEILDEPLPDTSDSTFKTVPDQPVTSFELTLPQGPYSALAANGNLCKSKLAMPIEFVAQNGAVIHESTKIGVTGCPKAKPAKKASKKHKKRKEQ
jgi:hypothetical protein